MNDNWGERVLIGIDVGTTSVKVVAVGVASGSLVASWSAAYVSSSPEVGAHEQEPTKWWHLVATGLREVVLRVSGDSVVAIGVSGHMHSLLLLDKNDEPVAPAMTWADRRVSQDTERLAADGRFRAIGGNSPVGAFTAPKLSWFARTRPALLARASTLLLVKDYIRLRLTGECATDTTDAMGTLLYDPAAGEWADDLWTAVGAPRSIAPPVLGSTEVAGRVTGEAAESTGLVLGTPVVCGAGDVVAAAVGAGVVRDDQICVNAGTAAQVMALARPSTLRDGFLFGSPWGSGYFSMAPVYAAGASIRWFERVFLNGGLIHDAAATEPGAHGLGYLPFMFGVAVPVRDDTVRARYFGQSEGHGLAEFARATIEGVAFGCADAIGAIAAGRGKVAEVRVVGGVSSSPIWCDVLASVIDSEILRVEDGGSAMGAALLAGLGVGVWDHMDAAAAALRTTPLTPPPMEARLRYRQAAERYRAECARVLPPC